MNQTPFAKPDLYVRCPNCLKGEHRIDHLLGEPGRKAGPWHCDECGVAFNIEVISASVVKTAATTKKIFKTEAHLVLEDPSLLPLTIIVRGIVFGEVGQDIATLIEQRDQSYFYEEHSCATNFLRDVEKVITADGDDDRHGLFRWEKTLPVSVEGDVVAPQTLPET